MGTKKKYKKWIMVIEMATEEMKINPKNLMVMDMATEKGIQRKRIMDMDMDTDILMATEEDMATVQ